MAHDGVRKSLLAVELFGDGRDLALGELPHGAADELVVVGEVEVHGGDYRDGLLAFARSGRARRPGSADLKPPRFR